MAERIPFCKAERTIVRSITMELIMRHGVKGGADPVGTMLMFFGVEIGLLTRLDRRMKNNQMMVAVIHRRKQLKASDKTDQVTNIHLTNCNSEPVQNQRLKRELLAEGWVS